VFRRKENRLSRGLFMFPFQGHFRKYYGFYYIKPQAALEFFEGRSMVAGLAVKGIIWILCNGIIFNVATNT
jgi:hypothetical protein